MDTTAKTYSDRSNARTAAKKMIAKNTAPSLDYGIRPLDNGRFEIVWKTNGELAAALENAEQLTTHELDAELAEAEAVLAETQEEPTTPPADPFPVGAWVKVKLKGKRGQHSAQVTERIGESHRRVHFIGEPEAWTHRVKIDALRLADEDEIAATNEFESDFAVTSKGKKPRVRSSSQAPAKSERRSRYCIDPNAIVAGKLPASAPVITSAANVAYYQPKFNDLFRFANKGEWNSVRDYKVSGSNSYSKLLERYRLDLLAIGEALQQQAHADN
jgi:hypothetical protein